MSIANKFHNLVVLVSHNTDFEISFFKAAPINHIKWNKQMPFVFSFWN